MGRACTEVAFSVEIREEKQQVGSPAAQHPVGSMCLVREIISVIKDFKLPRFELR